MEEKGLLSSQIERRRIEGISSANTSKINSSTLQSNRIVRKSKSQPATALCSKRAKRDRSTGITELKLKKEKEAVRFSSTDCKHYTSSRGTRQNAITKSLPVPISNERASILKGGFCDCIPFIDIKKVRAKDKSDANKVPVVPVFVRRSSTPNTESIRLHRIQQRKLTVVSYPTISTTATSVAKTEEEAHATVKLLRAPRAPKIVRVALNLSLGGGQETS